MPDREMVIKALEICAVGTNACTKCPLKDTCNGTSNAAMSAAIKLLKEQKPSHDVYCKNCGAWVDTKGYDSK